MLREMSSTQFSEWMAYYRGWPPEELDDHRFGVIASCIYNAAPRDKGNRKTFKPEDFFPSRAPQEPPTADDLLAKVVGINKEVGGTDQRRDGRR